CSGAVLQPLRAMSGAGLGSVPGFSGDNILQRDLFVWWQSDKAGLSWDHPEECSVPKSCQCPVPSPHYRAQGGGGFGSVSPPGYSPSKLLVFKWVQMIAV
uniref:Uncharacterized protein n=1 Tax=Geospiza parvula TaxID=87175 RepID=A0A8U8B499_GEOPR